MRQLSLRALSAAAAVSLATSLYAAVPTFWQVSNEADFLRGEVENLSVDGYGRLTLGPTAAPVYESNAPFLWAMLAGPDGSTFIGSGNEGQVLRVDASGKGSVFFDAEELEVHALAPAPAGGLYVGTSPDGKIYKVDAKGSGTVLFDPPDKYIWSLAVDKIGNVFAATGDKGVVYKISPDGKGAKFYETKATHAISLAFDREGQLLVGTESPGRVFRIDGNGKAFVLLDSDYNEIHALRLDAAGVLYAAAVGSRSGPSDDRPPARLTPEPTPPPTASVSTEITAIAVVDVAPPPQSGPPASISRNIQGSGAGAVYRITSDGASDLIWQSREDAPYDVIPESDGSILVATGNKGKIYRLTGDPLQPSLLTRATAQQVTAFLRDPMGRVMFTSSNPGKVFRLSTARADRGTYTSDVRDAQTVATWGTIRWQSLARSGAKVEIATRSGNTRTPDDTWSDWSAPYDNHEGSAISSPRARYLQWRAVLSGSSGDSPVLTSVTAAYLQRNTRPRVSSITIHPPGTVFQRPFPSGEPEIAGFEGDVPGRVSIQNPGGPSSPNLGRRAYQKGLLTFVWRAEDDNRDELNYDVLYRREGETSWKTLKQGLSDAIMVWDTTSVPNGRYLLKVMASDSPSNPPATALTGSMESAAFDIDNTPPVVSITGVRREGNRTIISFEARDDSSAVQKADYSLDGDRWHPVYPKDGIADSRYEQYELPLESDADARGVIIRVTDSLNNTASVNARGVEVPAASGRR